MLGPWAKTRGNDRRDVELAARKTLEKQEQGRVAAAASRATPARQRTDRALRRAPLQAARTAAASPGNCPNNSSATSNPKSRNAPAPTAAAGSPITVPMEEDKGGLRNGAAPANWPSPRDLDDLMADRELSNLQSLLKANNQRAMQQWLQVDPSEGLKNDVEKRRAIYGRNAFDAKPPTSFFAFWWDAMHDGAIIVLASVMAVVTILVWLIVETPKCVPNGYLEPVALVFSISVITLTTAGIDFSKERMFAALSDQLDASNKKNLC